MPVIFNPKKINGLFYIPSGATKSESAAFSYSKSSYRVDESNPTPTITGDTGGTFTASPEGLSINSSTGELTLSTSTINSYTVTYTLPSGTFENRSLGIEAAAFASTRSFEFDGVNDKFTVAEQSYSGAFSLSFWAKPVSAQNFVIGDNLSSNHFVWLNSATKIYLRASGNQFIFTESGGNDIVYNQWQNIIITRDASDNVNAYRNGAAFGGTSTVSGIFKFDSIGGGINFNSWDYTGSLDEFAIWNSELSSTAATEIYGTGVPNDLESLSNASSSNIVAWYRMGE
jgi:hypothetical protein